MELPGMYRNLWITILAFRNVVLCFLYAGLLTLLPIMVPGKVRTMVIDQVLLYVNRFAILLYNN